MENDLSYRLEKYRINAGLTVSELASKLGIKQSLAEDFEKGKANPDGNTLYELAELYDVTLDQLLNLDPDEIIRDDDSTIEPVPTDASAEKSDIAFEKRDHRPRIRRYIFFTLVTAAVYVILGITLGLWHPLWVTFLAVPVEVSFIDVICFRSIRKLNFPILVTFIYVLFGCLFGWWHPSWLIFITIPIFYMIF